MLKNKKNNSWFTLIELLVAISIVWILAIWVTNLNFNTISNKEKLRTYTNKIVNNIETVRNFALMWKWIWVSLDVPESWRIESDLSWSWKILVSYYNWSSWQNSSEFSTNFAWWYYIDQIDCLGIDWSTIDTFTWSSSDKWTLIFTWSVGWISWDCIIIDPAKIIKITTWYLWRKESFQINSVNWLIERNY